MNDNVFGEFAIVQLPGVHLWEQAEDLANQLERNFPNQGGDSLARAATYNSWGPVVGKVISNLTLVQEGFHGGPEHWIWLVALDDGSLWKAEGWCDFTGWDCQSDLTWDLIDG